jgi:hypothetical protein
MAIMSAKQPASPPAAAQRQPLGQAWSNNPISFRRNDLTGPRCSATTGGSV